MLRLILITVLHILMYKMYSCNENQHLCRKAVPVQYTTEVAVTKGQFNKYFDKLNILPVKENVTATKMEEKYVCCDGYEEHEGGQCELISTTTETSTESLTESEFDVTKEPKPANPQQQIPKKYLLCLILGSAFVIIVMSVVIFAYMWNSRKRTYEVDSEIIHVKFKA